MSFEDSPEYMFERDQVHIPPSDSDNIFNEVFDQNLYEVDNEDGSCELTNEVLGLYTTDALQESYPRSPSLCGSTSQETSNGQSPPQPWRKGLWCLNQDAIQVAKVRKPVQNTISTSQLVHNPAFLIRSPPTPNLSPTMKATKRFVTSPNAAKHRHKAVANLPLSRENTLSPSPMYTKLPLQAKMEQVETWQQDFKNFNIQTSKGHLTSQPTVPYRDAGYYAHNNRAVLASNATEDMQLISDQDFVFHNNGSEAAINPELINKSRAGLAVQTHVAHHKNVASAVPYSGVQQSLGPVWTTESLHSSNSSHQSSYDTLPPSLSSGMSSSGLHNPMSQTWWSPELGPPTPGWATTPREPFPCIAAPTPKRAVTQSQSFADNIDRHTDGLGIHYGDLNMSSEFTDSQLIYPSIETGPPHPLRRNELPAGIPPVPPLPFAVSNHQFQNSSPFATPRTVRRSPTRPPSPSISPLSTTPRSRRVNRSPSRPDHPSHNHHRRKSIHKPGPIKTNNPYAPTIPDDGPLPSASSTSRARSRSQSAKPPRTPKRRLRSRLCQLHRPGRVKAAVGRGSQRKQQDTGTQRGRGEREAEEIIRGGSAGGECGGRGCRGREAGDSKLMRQTQGY